MERSRSTYNIIFLVAFLFNVGNADAQRTDKDYLDSLKARLTIVKQDTNRCRVLNLIVQSLFRKEDYPPALTYTNEEIKLAETLRDSFWIAEGHKNRAALSYRLGDVAGSKEDCLMAQAIAEKHGNIRVVMMVTNILSVIYNYQSRYDLSLKTSFRALELCETMNAKYQESVVLTNLGGIYYRLRQREKAIECNNRALAIKRELDDFNDRDMLYNNNAISYVGLYDFKNATKTLQLAYSCQPKHENSFFTNALFVQAYMNYKMHRIDEAKKYFLRSYDLAKKYGDIRFQIENLVYIALCALEKNELKDAENAIKEGNRLVPNAGLYEKELDFVKANATLNKKLGNFEVACGYLEKYNTEMDSTFNKFLVQNLMVLHAEHEQQESKAILASQQTKLALKQQVINRQQPITILIGLSLVLLLIFTALFYQNYRRRQKINKLLEEKVRERNQELIAGYETMHRIHDQQQESIRLTMTVITNSLETIKDNSLAALGNENSSEREYFEQLIGTIDKMTEVNQNLALIS